MMGARATGSTSRIMPGAGWQRGPRPVGPNGRPTCRWCSAEIVAKRRSTFCGPACVDEWRIRSDPGYARRKALARDRGICQLCGLDTARLARILERLRARLYGLRPSRQDARHPYVTWEVTAPTALARVRRVLELAQQRGITGIQLRTWPTGAIRFSWSHLAEVDHIVPVVEGGAAKGLENLRTLCRACHVGETNRLNARLRARRRTLKGP